MAQTAQTARAQRVRVGPQGRLVIPAALRRALGLHPGEDLVAWVEGDRLVLRPRRAVEAELWAMFPAGVPSLAAELIVERRAEAAREAEG
jgi:AbrB family looped-hinge helix DNA binding protein